MTGVALPQGERYHVHMTTNTNPTALTLHASALALISPIVRPTRSRVVARDTTSYTFSEAADAGRAEQLFRSLRDDLQSLAIVDIVRVNYTVTVWWNI